MEELLCAEELVGSPWSDLKDEAACSNAESEGHYSLGFLEFPIHDDTTLACLLEREQELCPKTGYFSALQSEDICAARSNAVQWMLKVRSVYNFSPLTAILAVNYFDRYLSIHLAKCWKAWMIQLLSIACVSIAPKMEEIDVPLFPDLQIEGLEHVFDSRTIRRMELTVLNLLKWRMSPITPFSYVDDLLRKLELNRRLRISLLARVTELVLGTQSEIAFLEFGPSVIALAAINCALEEVVPLQADSYMAMLAARFPVEMSKVNRCYNMMEDLVADPLCPLLSLSQVLANPKSPPSPLSEVSKPRENWNKVEKNYDWSCGRGHQDAIQGVIVETCVRSGKRKLEEILE